MRASSVFTIAGQPALQVRHLFNDGPPVLYVHGATFPAALSIGYAFSDGQSWEAYLQTAGFDVWSFDFAGFGGSDRSGGVASLTESRAPAAAAQIARVVDHIRAQRDDAPVMMIAHSWGSIAAGCFLESHNHLVERLVFFGPIAPRYAACKVEVSELSASRLITVAAQLQRFIADVPEGEGPLLAEPGLERWGPAYLASDPAALTRDPPCVEVPGGPAADIAAAWQGELAYDPARVRVPTLLVRGEWDSLCTDEDSLRLLDGLGSEEKHDLVIPGATHLMHLETGRFALWESVAGFFHRRAR